LAAWIKTDFVDINKSTQSMLINNVEFVIIKLTRGSYHSQNITQLPTVTGFN